MAKKRTQAPVTTDSTPATDAAPEIASVDLGLDQIAENFADGFAEPERPRTDMIDQNPEQVRRWKADGIPTDPWFVTVRKQVKGEGHATCASKAPIEEMDFNEILRRWGPGMYVITGYNQDGHYVGQGKHLLKAEYAPAMRSPLAPPLEPQPQARTAVQANPDESFEKTLMRTLLLRLVEQPQPAAVVAADPMRNTMAEMLKMMQLQMSMSLTSLQAQQSISNAAAKPGEDMQARFFSLVEKQIAQRGNGGGGGFAEAMPILQLGMNLGQRMAGGAPAALVKPEGGTPEWLNVVPEIADTVGVPLIVAMAQALLPPDKAQQVLEAIGEHSKARQAEAKAAEKGGDAGPNGPHVDLG